MAWSQLSGNSDISVAENPHPGSVITPFIGVPGVLRGQRHTLRMRHHDRNAPIVAGKAANATCRSVRIGRVCGGGCAVIVDVTQRDLAAGLRVVICEDSLTFAMRGRDGQARTAHTGKKNGGALRDLDQAQSCFELLRLVTPECRPETCTGNKFSQVRQHLAAVTDTKRKAVARSKNAANSSRKTD